MDGGKGDDLLMGIAANPSLSLQVAQMRDGFPGGKPLLGNGKSSQVSQSISQVIPAAIS